MGNTMKGLRQAKSCANYVAKTWYLAKAREMYEAEGTIEFDDTPSVSRSLAAYGRDDGAYVAAWVWVPGLPPKEGER